MAYKRARPNFWDEPFTEHSPEFLDLLKRVLPPGNYTQEYAEYLVHKNRCDTIPGYKDMFLKIKLDKQQQEKDLASTRGDQFYNGKLVSKGKRKK